MLKGLYKHYHYSVMTGVRNGVIAKLRQDVSWLIGIHCVAHKLELAVLDGIKDVQYLRI